MIRDLKKLVGKVIQNVNIVACDRNQDHVIITVKYMSTYAEIVMPMSQDLRFTTITFTGHEGIAENTVERELIEWLAMYMPAFQEKITKELRANERDYLPFG